MPLKELRSAYGKTGGDPRQAINRAIRAELTGGAGILDLLPIVRHMAQVEGWKDAKGEPSPAAMIYERVAAIADELETEIRRRYEMPVE